MVMKTERMPVCGSRVCTGHNLHYHTKRLRWDLRLFVHNSVLRTVQVQQMIGTCLKVLEKVCTVDVRPHLFCMRPARWSKAQRYWYSTRQMLGIPYFCPEWNYFVCKTGCVPRYLVFSEQRGHAFIFPEESQPKILSYQIINTSRTVLKLGQK